MRIMLSLLIAAFIGSASAQQWELTTPIKTRSEFPGIRMVSDLVGCAIDLRTNATEA
jgi:hypothetical protein